MSTVGDPPAINTRSGFHAALRWGFDSAIADDARRIVCCDADFAHWAPLEDPAVLQTLTTWLKLPQRKLVLLARSYDAMPRRFPRFTAWRRSWVHAVDAWLPPEELAADLPSLLVSDRNASVQLFDPVHWRGRAAYDPRLTHQFGEQIDAVLQRSEPGFASITLGL